MDRHCDVVIVGARCAGASLAVMLARRGLSVIAVDKDRLPSDQILSTHTIHPPGMDVLDELGVGEEVRRHCPASPRIRMMKNEVALDLAFANGRSEYCPRRERLDGLLQKAAANAGAEVVDRCRVTSLVTDEQTGRVAGVRATRDGRDFVIHARVVAGADGRHSTIAKLTGAQEYLAYDAPRGAYWGYWNAPDIWQSDRYPFDMLVTNRAGTARLIFQTDENKLLIACAPDLATAKKWRSDPLAALTADLMSDPIFAPLVDGRPPAEPVRGVLSERYFFREGAGRGWALVGDAGHHKDYLIGDGITEALLQAQSLAPAILEDSDAALHRWACERDERALAMYYFAMEQGRPGPPSALDEEVFRQAAHDPELKARMVLPMEHAVSPFEVFGLPRILKWTLLAALKGRPRAIGDFLESGKRISIMQKELAKRRQLADAARAAVTPAVPASV